MATTATTRASGPSPSAPSATFGLPLAVVATAQLMLVLDDTIANIALPSIQKQFAVAGSTLPWIINAYVLAFGSLLLFGGRLGDLFGRRRVLRAGLALFIASSLLGGLGTSVEMLVAARGFQGLGAALIAPNVLALIATTFPPGKARNTAMAVYAGMSAVGITTGILLGGVLTGWLSWRWVFLINVPIGAAVLLGTRALLESERGRGTLNTTDAAIGSASVFALAYGITHGGEAGWSQPTTVAAFSAAIVLGVAFIMLQARRRNPMLPLALLRDRNRSGSYLTIVFIGSGLMATFYLLALYMQQVMQFSPVQAGLASLPVSVGIVGSAVIGTKLVERLAPRVVAVPGLLLGAAGMIWLSRLSPESSYLGHLLPALLLAYFGLGMAFLPLTLTAVHGVKDTQAGVASAILNTSQQIGAALGVSVLATIASVKGAQASDALTFSTALLAGAGMMIVAAILTFWMVNTGQAQKADLG